MIWLLALSIVTAVPPPPAGVPGYMNGGQFVAMCLAQGPDAEVGAVLCLGYLVGSVDQLLAREARRSPDRRTICLPKGATAEQVREAVMTQLVAHPEAQVHAAAELIRLSLETEFPCPAPGETPKP
ncbi:Rap1a/Tai family immunity protein [Phenylobacterium sp.]|uniref:Rap1a/Tai family immunity protein n=1 Tax=Phenylobacterium sp. TaxID=1871053 RepID=UPI0027217EC7|nr:Rap1a/Tai family immunity protein [Phenylobacterium sp.]MDO8379060.1 Rap1a/Tai family immunity protein [Phenylobacterium sp.]